MQVSYQAAEGAREKEQKRCPGEQVATLMVLTRFYLTPEVSFCCCEADPVKPRDEKTHLSLMPQHNKKKLFLLKIRENRSNSSRKYYYCWILRQ